MKFSFGLTVFFYLAILLISAQLIPAISDQRHALVIGNSLYPGKDLPTACNNAIVIEEALKKRGFEVILEFNINYQTMRQGIIQFKELSQSGGTFIFYYSGIAFQWEGETFLLPHNSLITNSNEFKQKAISLERIFRQRGEPGESMIIVILDPVFDHPFFKQFSAIQPGLPPMTIPPGNLLIYACLPNSAFNYLENDHSKFALELAKEFSHSSKELLEIFNHVINSITDKTQEKQIPWLSTTLKDDFYFDKKIEKKNQPPPIIIERKYSNLKRLPAEKPVLFPLSEFEVQLTDRLDQNFVKTEIILEVKTGKYTSNINKNLRQVREIIFKAIASKKSISLINQSDKIGLKEDIRRNLNQFFKSTLNMEPISNVYFKDMIIY